MSFAGDAQVMPYAWGEDIECLPQAPDVITGADVVYEQEHYAALVSSLHMLAAPHTIIYLSYRLRGTTQFVALHVAQQSLQGVKHMPFMHMLSSFHRSIPQVDLYLLIRCLGLERF